METDLPGPMSTEPTYTASEWRKKFEETWKARYGPINSFGPETRILDKLCPKPKKVRLCVEIPVGGEGVNFWRRTIGERFAGGTDNTIVAVEEVVE